MFNRRADGIRIGGLDPIVQMMPYLMPMRCDSQVFLQHHIDLSKMNAYIKKQRDEKGEKISHMQIIMAAYIRAVSSNPQINRFIMNKRYYSRNNCSISFNVLKDPRDADMGETVVKLKFDLTDTIYDVRDRVEAGIAANRGDQPKNFIDRLASFVLSIPGLPTALVAIVRMLDAMNMCPKVLIDELPFYSGLYVTNTASIGLSDVYHHIYNFGNVSIFLSMGKPERVAQGEGDTTKMKRFLPVGITVDERVCSGAHYALFFSDMKHYLDHPELLELAPETVKFDKNCEYHQEKQMKA